MADDAMDETTLGVPSKVTVVDPATGLCAILPAIQWATGVNNDGAGNKFRRIREAHDEFKSISKHTFVGFNGGHRTYAADLLTCRKVVLIALQQARIPSREKQLKLDVLCATEPERQRQYVECETIDLIQQVFDKHRSVRQQQFGKYRVDLYFPDAKLCVECDEEQHRWRQEEDQCRQQYIERVFGVRFLRFNTFDESFDKPRIIVTIMGLLSQRPLAFNAADFQFVEQFPVGASSCKASSSQRE